MIAWIFENEEYTELYHAYFEEFITEYFETGYFEDMMDVEVAHAEEHDGIGIGRLGGIVLVHQRGLRTLGGLGFIDFRFVHSFGFCFS